MNRCKFTFLLLICFAAGCSATQTQTRTRLESAANNDLHHAAVLENSRKFSQAAAVYASLAKQSPSAGFYKKAVHKAAHMNMHPDNPEADHNAAVHWLKRYLKLDLTSDERQEAIIKLFLLERINRLEKNLDHHATENKDLGLAAKKQTIKLASEIQRVRQLEKELEKTRLQLKEMKEVDLRMHMRRVNGAEGEPVVIGNEKSENLPPNHTDEIPKNGRETAYRLNNLSDQLKEEPQSKEKEETSDLQGMESGLNRHGSHPYTIQVASYLKQEDSLLEAEKSRKKRGTGYTSRVMVQGDSERFRVFVGQYQSLKEAENNLRKLQADAYPDAFVMKLPYAIHIDLPSCEKKQKRMTTLLRSKGYLTYSIPAVDRDGTGGLFVGAFETRTDAEKYAALLELDGLHPKVIQR